MIRFIDLRGQIDSALDYPIAFAFFDTIVDRFIEFDGEQVWNSRSEFIEVCAPESIRPLERFLSLTPEWVK